MEAVACPFTPRLGVHDAAIVTRLGMAAVAGLLVELDRLGVVFRHAPAAAVHEAEVVAAHYFTAIASLLQERDGLGIVFRHALALGELQAELVATLGIAQVTGLLERISGVFLRRPEQRSGDEARHEKDSRGPAAEPPERLDRVHGNGRAKRIAVTIHGGQADSCYGLKANPRL